MKLKTLTIQTALLLGMGVGATCAHAYWLNPNVTSQIVAQEATQEATKVRTQTQALAQTFKDGIYDLANQVNQSTMVENAQRNETMRAIIKADENARMTKLSVEHAQKTAEKIVKANEDYGLLTGQGYRPCRIITENQTTQKLMQSSKELAGKIAESGDNTAGRLVTSKSVALEGRRANHLENFCNENDVKSGECETVSDVANADTNSAVLFESASVGTATDIAKDAVRQNLMGSPHVAVAPVIGKTALGQAYLYQTNQHTALKSFPNQALAYLQAMSTVQPDIKDADGKPMSANEKAYATSARYFGSAESKDWLKSLAVQRFRGLLVEYSNLQDINLWQIHELKELTQMEIGVKSSGLLALTNAMDKDLVKQHSTMKRKAIASNVNMKAPATEAQ